MIRLSSFESSFNIFGHCCGNEALLCLSEWVIFQWICSWYRKKLQPSLPKLQYSRMMHHCLIRGILQRERRILIEHRFYTAFLVISNFWATVTSLVRTTSSLLLIFVQWSNDKEHWCCNFVLFIRQPLSICVFMILWSANYSLIILSVYKSMGRHFLRFTVAFFELFHFSRSCLTLNVYQTFLNTLKKSKTNSSDKDWHNVQLHPLIIL